MFKLILDILYHFIGVVAGDELILKQYSPVLFPLSEPQDSHPCGFFFCFFMCCAPHIPGAPPSVQDLRCNGRSRRRNSFRCLRIQYAVLQDRLPQLCTSSFSCRYEFRRMYSYICGSLFCIRSSSPPASCRTSDLVGRYIPELARIGFAFIQSVHITHRKTLPGILSRSRMSVG